MGEMVPIEYKELPLSPKGSVACDHVSSIEASSGRGAPHTFLLLDSLSVAEERDSPELEE